LFASLVLSMAAATKKEKKKLTLGRPVLVAGTSQTLSNLFWRLSISMVSYYQCQQKLISFREQDSLAKMASSEDKLTVTAVL